MTMDSFDRSSDNPLYFQLVEEIKKSIHEGVYPPGTRIPTEMEWMERSGLSRITVRKAMSVLVEEGVLTRRKRYGTFVTEKKVSRSLNEGMSFSETCIRHGDRPQTTLLSAELVPASETVKKQLQLKEPVDLVLRIRRLRFCNGEPVVLEENFYPRDLSFLLAEDLTQSLFGILAKHRIAVCRGDKTINVCYANHEEASLLAVPSGEAMLLTHDTVYDQDDRPVFTGHEVINPKKFEYRLQQQV